MRTTGLLFLLSLLSLPATAADIDIPFHKYTLDNGLTLIVHEDHKTPLVAMTLWYHVGSKNEKPGHTGFAHLFEHLMFNGSEHFNDEYFLPFEKAGATDMNGTTDSDRTNYFATVPAPALDMALWMESERMANLLPAVDQARLDEQRGVVKNEKLQGEDRPYGRVTGRIAAATFPYGHPYSWEPIGDMRDLDAATLDEVHDWFHTYYGPTNAVLVLAGDVDSEAARDQVQHYFGAIPPGPPLGHLQRWIAKRSRERRDTLQDRVPNARLYLVWNTPPVTDPVSDRLDLLADLLAGDASGVLQQRLVQQEKLATRVMAFQYSRELAGQFWIIADAAPGVDLDTLEQHLRSALEPLRRDGPDPKVLAMAKTSYRANFLRQLEKLGGFGGVASVLASGEVYAGDPAFYRKSLRNVAAATPAQLRSAAQKWLDAGVYSLRVEPFGSHRADGGAVDRSQVPSAGPAPQPQLPGVERAELGNGLQLVLMRRPGLPLVELEWQRPGGYSADGWKRAGTMEFALKMLAESSAGRDSAAVAAQLRRLGADLSTYATPDGAGVRLSALRDQLDGSVALLAQLLRKPDFEPTAVERLRRQTLARIAREQADPSALAQRVLPRLLFGTAHPYAGPLTGSGRAAVIEGLQPDALRDYHRRWFAPQQSTLIAVGDITLEELQALAQRHFGDWQDPAAASAPPLPPPAPASEGDTIYVIDSAGSTQANISMAAVLPGAADFDMDALKLANAAFGGAFSSRLNLNLREDKHWSYGTYSGLIEDRGPQLLIAGGGVQIDKTGPALVQMRKEWQDFTGPRPLTQAEFDKVREQRLRQLPGIYETDASLLQALAQNIRLGRPDDALAGEDKRLRALTLATAQQQVGKLNPRSRIWLVIGDKSQVLPQLHQLPWGRIVVLDRSGQTVADSD